MSFSPLSALWHRRGEQNVSTRESIAGKFTGDHILVPLLNHEVPALTDQIAVARTLARNHNASLEVVNPITIPGPMPSQARLEVTTANDRELLQWAIEQVESSNKLPC